MRPAIAPAAFAGGSRLAASDAAISLAVRVW